jgi:glycosyltransferase 2 family protein
LAARSLERIYWPWLLASLVPIALSYYGRALRWAVFLRPLRAAPSVAGLTRATVIGFTAIALFGRPGEFVRPYLISRRERVPMSSQAAAWLLERIFDLIMALVLFGFALSRVKTSALHTGAKLTWVLGVGGRVVAVTSIVVFLLLVSFRQFAVPMGRGLRGVFQKLPARFAARASGLVEAFMHGVGSIQSDGALLLILAYSVLQWALIVSIYWCLARSFGGLVPTGLVDVLIFMGFVSFGAAVQIPGVGGGLQVAAIVILTELFHVQLEIATVYAFYLWFVTFVVVVPAGLVLAFKEGLDWRALRQAGFETAK